MPKSIRVAIMDYMALDKKDLLTSVILRDSTNIFCSKILQK